MAWKRSDWNGIIQQINDLSQNPPEGCDALGPLNEVPPDHKWSVADIMAARSRLEEICDTNSFTAAPIKWAQALITELNDALDAGWCGCETPWEGPYTVSLPPDHTYAQGNIEVFPNFPVAGCTTRIYHWTDIYSWWNCSPCPSVGPNGITGRVGTLTVEGTKTAIYGGGTTSESFVVSGPIYENGAIGWLASRGGNYIKETQTWAEHPEWGEFVVYSNGYTFNFASSDLYVDRP